MKSRSDSPKQYREKIGSRKQEIQIRCPLILLNIRRIYFTGRIPETREIHDPPADDISRIARTRSKIGGWL